jgi:hypothetical protein
MTVDLEAMAATVSWNVPWTAGPSSLINTLGGQTECFRAGIF